MVCMEDYPSKQLRIVSVHCGGKCENCSYPADKEYLTKAERQYLIRFCRRASELLTANELKKKRRHIELMEKYAEAVIYE